MITFLPDPTFEVCARVLDWRRLNKQRSEAKLLLEILMGRSSGWIHHPIVAMWCGYERALAAYGVAICEEWRSRSYVDNLLPFFDSCLSQLNGGDPHWLGKEALHSSHRAALLAKDPEWYGRFGWTERPGIHYIWPIGRAKPSLEIRSQIRAQG